MSFDWSHYIDIAHELFRQSSNSIHTDADSRCSISRAYYGAFHKARHLLYNKWGVTVSKSAGAHSEVRIAFNHKAWFKMSVNHCDN